MGMDMQQKFGQMIMLGFHGRAPGDALLKPYMESIEKGHIGFLIPFSRNTTGGKQSLAGMHASLKEAAKHFPLGIAIDGEGGVIRRLREEDGYWPVRSAEDVAQSMTPNAACDYYEKVAQQYKDCGINFNLAPVVDVPSWRVSGCIGAKGRCYGETVKEIIAYATAFMEAHHNVGLPTCIKHWPGIGADRGDTHQEKTDLSAYWEEARDEGPFQAFKDMAPSVMVAHAYIKQLDKDHIATLSPAIINRLREKLFYKGLIISDALEMNATAGYGFEEMVQRAILAGNDVLIFGNHENDIHLVARAWQAVESAEGERREKLHAQIERAFNKIEAFKKKWF